MITWTYDDYRDIHSCSVNGHLVTVAGPVYPSDNGNYWISAESFKINQNASSSSPEDAKAELLSLIRAHALATLKALGDEA